MTLRREKMNRLVIIFLFQLTTSIYAEELDIILDSLINTHPEIVSLNSELNSKRANAGHETTYPDPKIGIALELLVYPAIYYLWKRKELSEIKIV
jgi:hypothetical protein